MNVPKDLRSASLTLYCQQAANRQNVKKHGKSSKKYGTVTILYK